MRKLRITMVILSGVVAALLWAHFAYRFYLFAHDYNRQPGARHMGNGAFASLYVLAGICGTLGIAAGILYESGKDRFTATAVAALNFIAIWGHMEMHRSGILVEYWEWASRRA